MKRPVDAAPEFASLAELRRGIDADNAHVRQTYRAVQETFRLLAEVDEILANGVMIGHSRHLDHSDTDL